MSTKPFLSVKVGDLMTRKVVNLDASMTATEVARLIVEHKIEGFPVTEEGKLVGIVTGWDLLTKVLSKGLDPSKVKVRDFMTTSPITCSPEYSVLEAAKLMAKDQTSCPAAQPTLQILKGSLLPDVTGCWSATTAALVIN